MVRLKAGWGRAVVAVMAVVLVSYAAGAELPTGATKLDGGEMPTGLELGKLPGNWSYKMDDWEWKQPVENQKRWDRETKGWWFNFGPTGIRVMFEVEKPRVAKVMYVYPDSPAAKKIFAGDEIIGVNGRKFTSDEPFPSGSGGKNGWRIIGPRLEVAKAIEESEGNPSLNGILTFTVKRGLAEQKVDIQLEKMGYFSPTFPYNCKKSRLLAERAGDWLIEHRRDGKSLAWGEHRMGDWQDLPAQLALLSFGDRYKKYFDPGGSGGVMWGWIAGIRLITVAEKQQILKDKSTITDLESMSKDYAAKSGPSGAYSHKDWYEGAPFQLAFAAGLNCLGQALAQKCGAKIDEASYLRTRYLLTVKTDEKGNIGYGASNKTPYSAEDARKAVGTINTKTISDDEWVDYRLVGGSACTTLAHFVDPRDSYSEAFVKRGVRNAMAAGLSGRQGHACGSLTFVYNNLAASIAPLVGEEKKYRIYMDEMKWWLIMARCHNGGWYFEPKIDTESNPYERIHMTAAAILMLNAPLHELYSNGKGRTDPGVKSGSSLASTISAPPAPESAESEPSTPVGSRPEPAPVSQARRLTAEQQAKLDGLLYAALAQLSEKDLLKPTPMAMQFTRQQVVLKSVEAGKLTFQPAGGAQSARMKWESLSPADRATLALFAAEVRPENGDLQAVAGVYMEHMGNTAAAAKHYEKAGSSSAAKLQKLFE